MITPYIYRYTLGTGRELTNEGKIVVYHKGERKEIETRNVEFFGDCDDYGNPKLFTMAEFLHVVKGTKGIVSVQGMFAMIPVPTAKEMYLKSMLKEVPLILSPLPKRVSITLNFD